MHVVEIIRRYSQGDGITQAAVQIAKALSRKKGFEVTLLHEQGEPPVKFALRKGFAGTVKYLIREADVAHSHIGASILKAGLSKIASPSITHVNTYSVIAPRHLYPYYSRAMAFHKLAYALPLDAVVGISKYACQDFEEKFNRPAELIYDGVDTRQFKPDGRAGRSFRAKHAIPQGAPLLGYMSRFERHKNHAAAIRCLAAMPREVHLALAGVRAGHPGTDTLEECRQLSKTLGLEKRVHFAGFVPNEEMNSFYNSLDVHLYPSQWEGFGLGILEASAAGKPTVAFKLYSVQELCGPQWGNGFCTNTQVEFNAAARKLLQDDGLRKRMSKASLRTAKEFAWEKVADKYAALFRQLRGY